MRSKLLDAPNKKCMPDWVLDRIFEYGHSDGPTGFPSEFELFLADSKRWSGLLFKGDWFVRQLLINVMMLSRVVNDYDCK